MEISRRNPEAASLPIAAARSGTVRLDRTGTLEIDGTRQRVRLCAERRGLPPLLVVQAGPGLPLLNEVAKFRRRLDLERDFTVAYWDQRGCGTAPRRDADGVSAATQVDDIGTVIRWLANQTGQRVVVLAVSLGATFALQAVAREAADVKALVAVSIDTSIPAGDAGAAEFLQQALSRTGSSARLAGSIRKLGPPPYLDPALLQSRARLLIELGGIENVASYGELARGFLFSLLRTYGPLGTVATLRNMTAVQKKLLPEIAALDLFPAWPRSEVPVHFLFGSGDALIPSSLVRRVSAMAAKRDTVQVISGARHMVHFDAPEAVRDTLIMAR